MMNAAKFLEFAEQNGVELWRVGAILRYRCTRKELTDKARALLHTLKDELLPLLPNRPPDPFQCEAAVYAVLQGTEPVCTILHYLDDDLDANLRTWIERAQKAAQQLAPFAELIAGAHSLPLGTFHLGEEEQTEDLPVYVLEAVYQYWKAIREWNGRGGAKQALERLEKAQKAVRHYEAAGGNESEGVPVGKSLQGAREAQSALASQGRL